MPSIIEIMNEQISASVVDSINNSNVLASRIKSRPSYTSKSMPWLPIRYTSMKAWWFLNYAVLLLMMTLFGAIIWGIIDLIK